MPDSPASGVQLAIRSRTDHAIERVPTGIAAFLGRTLKGPVNQPLSVRTFGEFQQHFGGLWQPSTLSYAVEHFFAAKMPVTHAAFVAAVQPLLREARKEYGDALFELAGCS